MKTLYILHSFGEGDIDMSYNKEYIEERKKILDYYSGRKGKSWLSIKTFTEEDDAKQLAHYRRVVNSGPLKGHRPWETEG